MRPKAADYIVPPVLAAHYSHAVVLEAPVWPLAGAEACMTVVGHTSVYVKIAPCKDFASAGIRSRLDSKDHKKDLDRCSACTLKPGDSLYIPVAHIPLVIGIPSDLSARLDVSFVGYIINYVLDKETVAA